MNKVERIEFYVSLNGVVMATCDTQPAREYTETDRNITALMLLSISRQYPAAYEALRTAYAKYKNNQRYYDYLCVHRFIRCNFGKADQLTWDMECGVLHIEDTICPLKWGKECPHRGIICNPNPYGLTHREMEVARMTSKGVTYKEISARLGIAHNTIKNIIQKITKKLHLKSSKDIARLFVVTI